MNASMTQQEHDPVNLGADQQCKQKLTHNEVQQLLQEPNGGSALIVLFREDKIDPKTVVDVLNDFQERPSSRMKRMLLALLDTLLPG